MDRSFRKETWKHYFRMATCPHQANDFLGLSNSKTLSIKNSLTVLRKRWYQYLPNLSELSLVKYKIQYLKPVDMKLPKALAEIAEIPGRDYFVS